MRYMIISCRFAQNRERAFSWSQKMPELTENICAIAPWLGDASVFNEAYSVILTDN